MHPVLLRFADAGVERWFMWWQHASGRRLDLMGLLLPTSWLLAVYYCPPYRVAQHMTLPQQLWGFAALLVAIPLLALLGHIKPMLVRWRNTAVLVLLWHQTFFLWQQAQFSRALEPECEWGVLTEWGCSQAVLACSLAG